MKPFFHVARIVLEARSPLMIASGEGDPNLDVLLARDVNGLPMLPATGVAGALRSLAGDVARFGDAGSIEITQASDVVFSDGLIHLSDDQICDGIMFEPPDDFFWQFYQQPNPVQRDHVKLDEFGAAETTAKFQRGAVPKGSRFSCEISLMSAGADDPDFARILALLQHPLFGLGGARRSGYGAMSVVQCKGRCFDLRDSEDWQAYREFRERPVGAVDNLSDLILASLATTETISLALKSEGYVMVGAGSDPIGAVSKLPDQSPYRESQIRWKNGKGSIADSVIIPGSAIKGPLRRRTLFHYRQLFSNDKSVGASAAIDELFGTARNEATGKGGAGKIRVADASPLSGYDVEKNARILQHVSVDRFSGGAYRSALFNSQALWRMPITVAITLENGISDAARKALDLAIKDLKSGHLQIGADGGDGLGVFLEEDAEMKNGSA